MRTIPFDWKIILNIFHFDWVKSKFKENKIIYLRERIRYLSKIIPILISNMIRGRVPRSFYGIMTILLIQKSTLEKYLLENVFCLLGGYEKFTGLKVTNPKLKTMLVIGGTNQGSAKFTYISEDNGRRKTLVKNFIKVRKFYFLDYFFTK